MQITVTKRYLVFPVSREIPPKHILFRDGSTIASDLAVSLDPVQPEFLYYWDARELLGRTLDLSWDEGLNYIPEMTDTVPTDGLFRERFRPIAHFTPARGWINDPNGLVFYEGFYHMFYQHNPVSPQWGNMHWGHAVSSDLVHWEEKELALFPDELGTMYSGSAIVDTENVSGLKENEHDPLLLFYTAAGRNSYASAGKAFTQCLAYSTDGGVTFHKYANNPIVPHLAGDNRDPKVIYVPEVGCYYMALYLTDHEYALLSSHNLLDWTEEQRLTHPGDDECPDFFPISADSGKRFWVLLGASDRYLVGTIQNRKFCPIQEARDLQIRRNGSLIQSFSYAAQSFSHAPNGRNIRISWNTVPLPRCIANGSMCTPAEFSLKEESDGFRLCLNPVPEWSTLVTSVKTGSETSLTLAGPAQDILLEATVSEDAEVDGSLFGLSFHVSASQNTVKIRDLVLPLFRKGNAIRLRFITDVHSTEVYIADGETFICVNHPADETLNRFVLTPVQGTVTVQTLQAKTLKNYRNL